MSRNSGGILLVALATLVAVDVVALVVPGPPAAAAAAFQRASAGVGGSSDLGVSWSFHAFDPRLEACCENELWPIPGAHCPNPSHGAGVSDYPARRAGARVRLARRP